MEALAGCRVQKGKIHKLIKSLYGLKQAPKLWHQKLADALQNIGFKESGVKACLFERDNATDEYAAFLIYVDYLTLAAILYAAIQKILKQLG